MKQSPPNIKTLLIIFKSSLIFIFSLEGGDFPIVHFSAEGRDFFFWGAGEFFLYGSFSWREFSGGMFLNGYFHMAIIPGKNLPRKLIREGGGELSKGEFFCGD